MRLGWYRHGRGTSLGQECHLVAINSYYGSKSTSRPFLGLPRNTSPVHQLCSGNRNLALRFLYSQDHPFFGFLKLCCRPQQQLLAAVPWQPSDTVLAQERGLRGLLVSHKQIKSRPSQALLCCSLRQLYPIPSAPCTLRRRCDALLDMFLSAGSCSVAVASLRMWELQLMEREMVPFISCLVVLAT